MVVATARNRRASSASTRSKGANSRSASSSLPNSIAKRTAPLKTAAKGRTQKSEPTPAEAEAREALKQQIKQIAATNVRFVNHSSFAALPSPAEWSEEALRGWRREMAAPSDSTVIEEETDVSRLCETGLLTPQQEVTLFRTMNQLKFGAARLQASLRNGRASAVAVAIFHRLVNESEQIRNHIVQANVRLVIAIVKRLTGPQHNFDEFVSDGMLSLMQVVDKFDFDRGFRFSTYAYRAITRTVYRRMVQLHKQETRVSNGMDEALMEVPNRTEINLSERTWSNLRELLSQFMEQLDPREQLIIESRYALGIHIKGSTFQALADELGVSKERVRQLERRAVTKLQALAEQVDLDKYVEASAI